MRKMTIALSVLSLVLTLAQAASPTTQPTTSSKPAEKDGLSVTATPAIFDTPEALTTQLADAIEARDRSGMHAAFGVDLAKKQEYTDALWVSDILAVLRLRDAMKERFGADTTAASLKDIRWLAAPDIQRLRTTQWTMQDGLARVKHERNEDDYFRIAGVIMFMGKEGQGWRLHVSKPATDVTELRQNRKAREHIKLTDELTKAVKAGTYKTAEEVALAAQRGEDALEKDDHLTLEGNPMPPTSQPAAAWTKLSADETWYKDHKQSEQVFTGVLQRNKEPEASTLMRSRRYQLGDRFVYPGKENPELEKLVGQKVDLKGKPYDVELEGQNVHEIWPAAIRPAAATQPATSSKPVEKDGLSISVALPKATFAADEPLKFTVQFKNVSDKAFLLFDAAYFWDWTIRFEQKGGPWRLNKLFETKRDYSNAHTALKSGDTLDVPVVLAQDDRHNFVWEGRQLEKVGPVTALPVGRYLLTIEVNLKVAPTRLSLWSWTGTITSNPVEVEITGGTTSTPASMPTTMLGQSVESAWQVVLTALQAGDAKALGKVTTEQGYRSIMGVRPPTSPDDMRSWGQAWAKWPLRFTRKTDDAASANMGPEAKEQGLDFVKTKDGWKLDKWTPGR